jgi:hypothetical protein
MGDTNARLKGLGLVVLGPGLLIGGGVWEGRSALQTLREDRIWQTGKTATNVTVSGKEYRKGPFSSYDARITYLDEGRGYHLMEDYSLHSFWTLAHIHAVPTVKYDPADPNSFATAFGQQLGWGRWAHHALILALVAVFGLVLVFAGWGDLRGPRASAAAGR